MGIYNTYIHKRMDSFKEGGSEYVQVKLFHCYVGISGTGSIFVVAVLFSLFLNNNGRH